MLTPAELRELDKNRDVEAEARERSAREGRHTNRMIEREFSDAPMGEE